MKGIKQTAKYVEGFNAGYKVGVFSALQSMLDASGIAPDDDDFLDVVNDLDISIEELRENVPSFAEYFEQKELIEH